MRYKTKFAFLLATWFYAGKSPKAPGTAGSLAALPFAWVMMTYANVWVLPCAALVLYFIGVWCAGVVMDELKVHDPGMIVVDEVVGQWLTVCVAPPSFASLAAGFVLFRLFDITKPFPIGYVDKNVKGGTGVMLDDVLAGLVGAVCLYASVFLFPGFFSL